MDKFNINGVDMTSFVNDVTIDHGIPDSEIWGEYLAGLKSASATFTFNNSGGMFQPFPETQGKVRVTFDVPDGRWQGWLPRLFSRLKVRYISHSFNAVLDQWDGGPDVTGRVEGTIAKSMEEHR
jgi:hypothetical protein